MTLERINELTPREAILVYCTTMTAWIVLFARTETTFIDSTGLGVLIRGVERLTTEDGRLAVVCIDPNMVKVFEVTGLDRVFTIYSTREEALAQVA